MISTAKRAGIRTLMITGDHSETASAVARDLGIAADGDEALTGKALDALDDTGLELALRTTAVFARVNPEHKIRIVQALRRQGEIVAVTGDGVNDAPALKAADIGVAVGSGTDVAKETADIVLLDDSFATMVVAIREGRNIYQNIKKVVLYLLAGSFAEVVLIVGCLLGKLPLAVLPTQILWVNIIQDSFPPMALAFDAGDPENMLEPPRPKNASLFDSTMKTLIVIVSVVSNIVLFGLFLYFLRATGDIARTRTLMFIGLAIDSLLYIYAIRTMRRHFWQAPLFDNHFLTASIVGGFALLLAAIYVPWLQELLHTMPVSATEWAILVLFGVFNVLLIEAVKHITLKNKNHAPVPPYAAIP
jgi:Ca2+-transporting ATPase